MLAPAGQVPKTAQARILRGLGIRRDAEGGEGAGGGAEKGRDPGQQTGSTRARPPGRSPDAWAALARARFCVALVQQTAADSIDGLDVYSACRHGKRVGVAGS